MKLNVTLRDFTNFSSAVGRGVDSTEIATFFDGKIVSLSDNRVGGNAACSVGKRSGDAKSRNDVTRAALICALLQEYKFEGIGADDVVEIKNQANAGNWKISKRVLDIIADKLGSDDNGISRKDFNCGKPLTARRIEKIMAAVQRAGLKKNSDVLNEEVSLVDVSKLDLDAPIKADSDPTLAPYSPANTYLVKCRNATDIDSFLANASMAFALCGEDGLNITVGEIAELCGSKFYKKLDEITKYAEKVDAKDADKTGFLMLLAMFKARETSHDILMNTLIQGKLLTKDYEIDEVPMPKAGVDKITEYANEDVKKAFVSKFAGKEFDETNLKPEEDPFTRKDTQKGYVYSILIGDDEDFNKMTGNLYFKGDGARGLEIKLDGDDAGTEKVDENAGPQEAEKAKVNENAGPQEAEKAKVNGKVAVHDDTLNDEDKKYYKTIANNLISYFTIGGVLQKASLAKFLVLAHQGIISATQTAAVYRRTAVIYGDDEKGSADYANKMGVIPVSVASSHYKSASRQLCLTKNNGVITLHFSEELMGERGDCASADPTYSDLHDANNSRYSPRFQMGDLKHNVKVSFSLSNDAEEDTKVLSATASAKYLAYEKEFPVEDNPVVEGANNNE